MRKNNRERIVKSILDISGFTNFVESPELILGLIIEECVLITKAAWGLILAFDPFLNVDTIQAARRLKEEEKVHLMYRLNNSIRDITGRNKSGPILEFDFWNKRVVKKGIKEAIGKGVRGLIICPIEQKGRLLGLVVAINKKSAEAFSKADEENIDVICKEASVVLQNINLFKAKVQNEKMAAIGMAISSISHYVKNILQGIKAGSYLLSAGVKEKNVAAIEKAWNILDKNTKRISDLIMDMLYYAKGRKPIITKTDPAVLIKDVMNLAASRAEGLRVKLKTSIKELPDTVEVNEQGLHRSLLNIVLNAIEACEKANSYVKLEAVYEAASRDLKITVSDNGHGMAKEDCEKIFQPFFTMKSGGTGLGLAITKKIIEEHNGSIAVDSVPSKGTTFTLTIPV